MKQLLSILFASTCMMTSFSSSAAYSYSYVNFIDTIATTNNSSGEFISSGPTVYIKSSYLFQDKLEANKIYNRNDISGWVRETVFSPLDTQVTSWVYERDAPEGLTGSPWLKTNSNGEISDWFVLSAFGGHTAWTTTPTVDTWSFFTSDTIWEGANTHSSSWIETYIADPVVYNFNNEIIPLPVPGPPSSIPEPETYAMLLAGLSVLTLVARRKLY